jgi:hypothetical protein
MALVPRLLGDRLVRRRRELWRTRTKSSSALAEGIGPVPVRHRPAECLDQQPDHLPVHLGAADVALSMPIEDAPDLLIPSRIRGQDQQLQLVPEPLEIRQPGVGLWPHLQYRTR